MNLQEICEKSVNINSRMCGVTFAVIYGCKKLCGRKKKASSNQNSSKNNKQLSLSERKMKQRTAILTRTQLEIHSTMWWLKIILDRHWLDFYDALIYRSITISSYCMIITVLYWKIKKFLKTDYHILNLHQWLLCGLIGSPSHWHLPRQNH